MSYGKRSKSFLLRELLLHRIRGLIHEVLVDRRFYEAPVFILKHMMN